MCGDLHNYWHLIAIFYTVVLFFLNFIRIFDNNFWGDEGYSIGLAKMTFADMVQTTANDVHPPLYYAFLILAYRLFGEHGWVFHFVSIIPYIVILIFSLTVIWKNFGKEASFLMVTFSSVITIAITYNVEARMYSMAAMFVLLAYYGLFLIMAERKKGIYGLPGYVLFVFASLGAAYSHYYALLSVAFFYLALLARVITKKLKLWKMAVVYIVTIAGYMPWLVIMLNTFRRTADNFWLTIVPTFEEGLCYFYKSGQRWYSLGMFFFTVAVVLFLFIKSKKIITLNKCYDDKTKFINSIELVINKIFKDAPSEIIWLLWGLIAPVGTLITGKLVSMFVRPVFILRYLYVAVPVIWLVLSAGITMFKFKKILVPLIITVTLIICLPEYSILYQREKTEGNLCNSTVEIMQEKIMPDDVILTNGTHLAWTIIQYYMPGVEHKLIETGYNDFEYNTSYWLLWTYDVNDAETEWINGCGYEIEEVIHSGMLGSNYVHLYHMAKK